MSFYGSVYYQATQAFAKILLKNSGIENIKFYTGDLENSSIESASRNGAFYVDAGNRWIQIVPDTDGFTIWHNKPREGDDLVFTQGFRVEENPLVTDSVVELKSGDYLEVPMFFIDEAGHIVPGKTEAVYYRMPVLEIETDIDTLTERMDTAEDDITTLEANMKTTLQNDSDNQKNIMDHYAEMKESFGNLKNITTNGSSMESVIGNFQLIRNAESDNTLTMTQHMINNFGILDEVRLKLNETIANQESIYADLVKRVGVLEDTVRNLTTT